MVRAPDCRSGGCGFDPRRPRFQGHFSLEFFGFTSTSRKCDTDPVFCGILPQNGVRRSQLRIGHTARRFPNSYVRSCRKVLGCPETQPLNYPRTDLPDRPQPVGVDGDRYADVIAAAGVAAYSHIEVFSGAKGAELASFLAPPGVNGAVSVAAGDLDGDRRAELIVRGSSYRRSRCTPAGTRPSSSASPLIPAPSVPSMSGWRIGTATGNPMWSREPCRGFPLTSKGSGDRLGPLGQLLPCRRVGIRPRRLRRIASAYTARGRRFEYDHLRCHIEYVRGCRFACGSRL